jgi:hypothetical protein
MDLVEFRELIRRPMQLQAVRPACLPSAIRRVPWPTSFPCSADTRCARHSCVQLRRIGDSPARSPTANVHKAWDASPLHRIMNRIRSGAIALARSKAWS